MPADPFLGGVILQRCVAGACSLAIFINWLELVFCDSMVLSVRGLIHKPAARDDALAGRPSDSNGLGEHGKTNRQSIKRIARSGRGSYHVQNRVHQSADLAPGENHHDR